MLSMASLSSPSVGIALLSLLSAGTNAEASTSPIRYQDGWLSANIENKASIEVLRELSVATGAPFALSDPGSGQTLVSATIEPEPFVHGVKRILEGFSYVIYPVDGRELPAVIVLSTPPVQRSSGVSGATRQRPASSETRAAPIPTVLLQEAADEAEQAEALAGNRPSVRRS
jgi:hypothetical protein